MKEEKQQSFWHVFSIFLVLAVISGALAGVVASVITNQSLDEYSATIGDRDRFFSISEVKPRPLPGTYEEALARVQESGWSALALARPKTEDTSVVSAWVSPDDVTGVGTVLTSDGWMLFDASTFASFEDPATSAEIWIQHERFEIDEFVRDTRSDFVLVRVDAQSLSTLAFGGTEEMRGGDILFATSGSTEIVPTSLKDADALTTLVHPVESFSTDWELSEEMDAAAPLLNSSGELVGFTTDGVRAEPLHHLRPFIQSVLRHGEPQYPGIGAYTVSVSQVLNMDAAVKEQAASGELVVSPGGRTLAVRPDSPAQDAELVEGDIIISIDDVLVTPTVTLAELLTAYEPEDNVALTLLRDGEEVEVVLTLTNLDDLVY